ncbi:MAG TPA: sigma 54-interacting transcriptional regulator [Tepidisphaeraceae bacterium]|jgi:formate hydrogenlyase transcriptional activator|nr:sigma 54-interacting transcriptional regulator [Tepidisphaeraceae bacterium]
MADDSNAIPEAEEIEALRSIVEGASRATGREFFKTLAKLLAAAMGVGYAFVAEFIPPMRARTLGYWKPAGISQDVEWDLRGTPCEDVVKGNLCHHTSGVWHDFPRDRPLVDLAIESYLGVPLVAADGQHLGHLAVFDTLPMPLAPRKLFIFRIFANRAVAELERLRSEQRLAESEKRFRDLYEEAPIAYIYEGVDSRFVAANRAATRLLGIKPEEVSGMLGISLIPPDPEAQAKARKAIEGLHQGKEQACVELELRRKDDGRPVWVQWYSKPETDGKRTRTMLVDITERVLMEREKTRLEHQNQYLQEEIKSDHNFEEIVGRSGPIISVLESVHRVAATDASVLICGETGTGKELIARAVHSASARHDKPLVKVNCAALPTGLVESELFGHERGAFSGAIARRIGRFELAHGGTIFLDEIGEVPLEVQVKLLRALQEREFERVGGGAPIKVDVRIIAATNRDLVSASRQGKFREDLFYRLNVFPILLPPLRQRKQDIPLLVQFLLNKFATRIGKRIRTVTPQTMHRLCEYEWPGNVRELENLLERAVILANSDTLEIDPRQLETAPPLATSLSPAVGPIASQTPTSLEELERSHILAVLKQTNWVIEGARGAARILDLHPNTLRSRLKKLGLSRAPHRHS